MKRIGNVLTTENENKVFAFKDKDGKEIILGDVIYLGKNDDGSRYYEVDKVEEIEDLEHN